MVDITKLGESIVGVVKGFVAQQVGALSTRVDALLARVDSMPAPKDGQDGKDGLDGKSVAPAEVEALVLRAVEALPPAKDGASVTVYDVAPLIVAEVTKAVAAIPQPKDGEDGKDAQPLDHGAVVKDVLAAIRVPEDGKSVTPAEVEPMLAGLVVRAVAELPKPKDGKDGKDGESVPVDQVQRMIDDAVTKAIAAVPAAKDGEDGEHGRDAADIEILPAINEARRYARGTYASHKGGVWVARRSTDGMDGWACIVNGVSEITVDQHQDDPRKFFVSIGTAAGIDAVKEFVIPAMVYKGVFKEGDDYSPGDTCTWGGSLWHCNEPTKDKPIDGSKAWQLAAKRGRDGHDGTNGKDLTRAVKLP